MGHPFIDVKFSFVEFSTAKIRNLKTVDWLRFNWKSPDDEDPSIEVFVSNRINASSLLKLAELDSAVRIQLKR